MQTFQLDYVDMPKLIISGTPYELVDDLVTIGRGPDNTIVVSNPSVSARHAQLHSTGETYRLKDLGSTNGTHVNGKPVTETILRFDDRIRFGAAEARYESDASGSRPLPEPEEIKATAAELSEVPADFANVSPFQRQKQQSDPVRNAIFIGLAIVLLVFLASMIAVVMMHAPTL
jgi:predicted component of type VI protein secretion system